MTDSRGSRPVRSAKSSKPRSKVRLTLFILGGVAACFLILTRVLFNSFSVPSGAMENSIMAGDAILVNTRDREVERGDIIVFAFPGMRDQVQANEFQYYLKRTIALAGDILEVRNKDVYINGVMQQRPPNAIFTTFPEEPRDQMRTFPEGAGYTRDNWGPMRVPKKGDVIPLNDSTFWGWRIFIQREGTQVERAVGKILIDGQPATQYIVKRDYCFGMGDNRDNSLDSRYWGFIPVDDIAGKPVMVYWSQDPIESEIRWDRFFMTVE